MKYIKNIFKHLKKIITHKIYVGYYCFKFGIPIQGLLHDLSKFSPVEFFESVKYYQGDKSPIDACKKANGWSKAWMHHKGRNPHHYEYWMDDFDHGGKPLMMPAKYAIEMLCDYLGAGRAYMGKSFNFTAEYAWWLRKRSNGLAMRPELIYWIDLNLASLSDMSFFDCSPNKFGVMNVRYAYLGLSNTIMDYYKYADGKHASPFVFKEIEFLNKKLKKYDKKCNKIMKKRFDKLEHLDSEDDLY